jgi:hypothetical protein
MCRIQGSLKAIAFAHQMDGARRGGIGKRTFQVNTRQFSGTIEAQRTLRRLLGILRSGHSEPKAAGEQDRNQQRKKQKFARDHFSLNSSAGHAIR